MDIRRCLIYVIINCVLITHLEAKTVSLNELLAAESKEKQEKARRPKSIGSESKTSLSELTAAESKQTHEKASRPKSTGSKGKTVSLNELIAAESKQNHNKKVHHPKSSDSKGKTVSLNEVIAAETKQNHRKAHHPKSSGTSLRRQSFSLKDLFTAETKQTKRKFDHLLSRNSGAGLLSHRKRLLPAIDFKNFESVESLISRGKTLSPLAYKKKFEIKSPLKPKKLKHLFNPRLRRRQSKKREIFENEQINNKYVPLIKRLGMLVDDILASGSGESHEVSTRRPKRKRKPSQLPENRTEPKCKCEVQTDSQPAESKPHKKTVVPATTVSAEVTTDAAATPTEAPTTAADNTPTGNVYTVRPDPNLSLLFTRNSTSSRRDYYGFSERSGSALYRDIERNITRNNGDYEYNSRGRRNQTCLQNDEENPCGSTRDDANSDGSVDGDYRYRTNPRHPHNGFETEEIKKVARDDDGFLRRSDDKTEEENKFKVGRETEETIPLQGDVRRLRGLPKHAVIINAKSVQPEQTSKESLYNVAQDHTSAERVAQWYGTPAAENQKLRSPVETVKPINDLLNSDLMRRKESLYNVAQDRTSVEGLAQWYGTPAAENQKLHPPVETVKPINDLLNSDLMRRKESLYNVAQDRTSAEGVAQWYGTPAAENQKLRPPVETVKPINDLLNSDLMRRKESLYNVAQDQTSAEGVAQWYGTPAAENQKPRPPVETVKPINDLLNSDLMRRKESLYNIAQDQISAEGVAQWYGTPAAENQKPRPPVETVKPMNDLLNSDLMRRNSQPNQVVTIFDGYSVARDINGRNNLTEKSIRITS